MSGTCLPPSLALDWGWLLLASYNLTCSASFEPNMSVRVKNLSACRSWGYAIGARQPRNHTAPPMQWNT
eukprot:3416440-Amphidinium_carterae.1